MNEINASRLKLLELSLQQLKLCLFDLPEFERQKNIRIASNFITDRVQRAIRMKIKKMRKTEPPQQSWLTYWLIIIKEENIGAGMLGFKGYPNAEGSTEIGYGIDPAYKNKGYMSEAVKALIEWAFTHPFCKTITATEVYNPASKRLLEKLGSIQTEANEKFTSWEIQKPREEIT